MKKLLLNSVVLLISVAAQRGNGGEWVSEDGIEGWRFETPSLTGLLVARDTRELGKGYGKHGLREVVFKPTGDELNAPEGKVGAKRRHQGLLNLYRVYGDGETFGSLRDDQAEAEPVLADDGKTIVGAKLTWLATEERPVSIEGIWTVTENRIEVDIVARPERAIRNFEILPATYLPVEMVKGLYVAADDGKARAVHLRDAVGMTPRADENGRAQYAFYPLSNLSRPAQERSGRTTSSWYWPSFVTEANAAIPVIFASGEKIHVVHLSDAESTSAVCVTPVPEDMSSDPETWNSVQQHSALYFSLFGSDVEEGGEYKARMSLVVVPAPEGGEIEAVHRKLFEEFNSRGE